MIVIPNPNPQIRAYSSFNAAVYSVCYQVQGVPKRTVDLGSVTVDFFEPQVFCACEEKLGSFPPRLG